MLFRKYIINVVIALNTIGLFGVSISNTPVCEVFTPKSLYGDKVFKISFVGDRSRASTCGGVAWFHDDNYLATVNFEGGFICTYKFNKSENQFVPLQIVHETQDAKLFSAENVTFSPDGKLLAVSMNHTKKINVYRVSTETHLIDPIPVVILQQKERNVHGIRFSHNNNYLASTTVRGSSPITIYKREEERVKLISQLENSFKLLKPKSLDFTHDDTYIAVVYAANVINIPNKTSGLVAIFKFDKNTGIIDPNPVSLYQDNDNFDGGEDINFSPDDSCIFISEHARDRIIVHEFDKIHGKIGKRITELKNPEARLSFPHGLNISSDGKYLAVAHYGDDKFSVYLVH